VNASVNARWYAAVGLVVLVLAAGCAPPQPIAGGSAAGEPQRQSAPKRLVAAIRGNPISVSHVLTAGGGGRIDGAREVNGLTSSGLTARDSSGQSTPVLAERIPSIDDGSWRVFPDGRMETTWTLRPGALWHDGTPFTAEDLLFTARLGQDRDMPWPVEPVYRYVAGLEALDARTLKISWKEPYIRADQASVGSSGLPFNPPFPRHLLESTYLNEKESLPNLPYWTTEFVGSGPFQVKDFVRDSHVALIAFDRYVLGRPKIDELEVRFIPDDNALAANILAGSVELMLGPGVSLEQGIQVRDRWPQGKMKAGPSSYINMNTQFLNPDPPILADVRFRRALYMAIDRQQLVDELTFGLSEVAHSSVHPSEPEYRYVEPSIVRYPYDPRAATQAIESLGYRKGADGMFQDATGKPLTVQVMATQDDANAKPQFAVLDYFKSIGITPDAEVVTPQRQRDLAYRASFKSFSVQAGISSSADGVSALLTREMRTADINYTGRNYTRYSNPAVDALVDRYYTTIPFDERMGVLSQIIRHTTENLVWLPLYWRVLPTLMHERISGVDGTSEGSDQWWNAHQWDLR
jgi:peptide/nickel transport system substrate-binding protein